MAKITIEVHPYEWETAEFFDSLDTLQHHGVKGMHWGASHQRALDRYTRVASGTGSKADHLRTASTMDKREIKKAGGYKEAVKIRADKLQGLKDRSAKGTLSKLDKVKLAGHVVQESPLGVASGVHLPKKKSS